MNPVACCLLFVLGLLPSLVTAQTSAPKPKLSSASTMLKDCKLPQNLTGREGGDFYASCKPVGGYFAAISYDAALATVTIKDSSGRDVAVLGTDYIAIGMQREQVEWRLAGGKPFAVIFRAVQFDTSGYPGNNPYKAFNEQSSVFVVKGLHGCEGLDCTIDADRPGAAALARRYADEAFLR